MDAGEKAGKTAHFTAPLGNNLHSLPARLPNRAGTHSDASMAVGFVSMM
jgi:hypothetical protein